jgi:hypothetical protein
MARFLFFALIGVLFWAWLSRKSGEPKPPLPPGSPPSPEKPGASVIVPCADCGIHFPQSDGCSITSGGVTRWYCCTEHRDRAPLRGG